MDGRGRRRARARALSPDGEQSNYKGYKKLRLLNPEPNSASLLPSKTLLQSINERMPSFLRSEAIEPAEPQKSWNPHPHPQGSLENRKTELKNKFNRLSVSAQDSEYQYGIGQEQVDDQPFTPNHERNQDQVQEEEKNRRRSEWLDSDDEDNVAPGSRQAARPRSDPRNKDPMVQVAQSLAEDFKAPAPNFVPDPNQVLRSTNSTLSEFYNTFVSTTEQYQSSKVIINAYLSSANGQKNAMICASETRQLRNALSTSRSEQQQKSLVQEQLVSPSRNTLYLSPESLEYIHNWLLYTLQYPVNTEYAPVSGSPCVTPMGPNSDFNGVRDMGPPNTKLSSGKESNEENSQELLSSSQREILATERVQHSQANQPAFQERGEIQHQTFGQSQRPPPLNIPTFFPREGQHPQQQVQQNQTYSNQHPAFNSREMHQSNAQTQQSRSSLPPFFQHPNQSHQLLTRTDTHGPPTDIFDFSGSYNFNFPINAPTPAPFRTRPLRPMAREPESFIVQQTDHNSQSQQRTSLQSSQPIQESLRRMPEAAGSLQQSSLPYFPQAQPASSNPAQNTMPWRSVFETEKYLRPPPQPVNLSNNNFSNPNTQNSYRTSENALPVFPRSEIEGRQYQAGYRPDSYQYTSAYADNINSQYFSSSAKQSSSFDYPPPETMRQSSGYCTMNHSRLDPELPSFVQSSPPISPPANSIPNRFSESKSDLPEFELTPIPVFNGKANDSFLNKETERQEPMSPLSDSKESDSQDKSASEGLSSYFQDNLKLEAKPFQFATKSPRNGLPSLLPFKPNSDLNGEWNDDQIFDTSTSWENWDCEVTKDAIGEEWLVTEDQDGFKMYINLKTGVSSYDMRTQIESRRLTSKEAAQINPNFSYNWLRRYFPKGSKFWKPETKHLLKNGNIELAKNGNTILGLGIQQCLNGTVDELMASKWREGVLLESNKTGSNSNNTGIVRVTEYWERPLGAGEVPVVNLNAPEIHFWKSVTNSCKFSKADLKLVKVIAQVDKKFIVARAKVQSGTDQETELLILFDQHAVHERIRLEMLMTEIYAETSPGTKEITSVCISPPIPLSLSDTEVRIMVNYVNDFEGIGIKFKQIDSTTVNILSAPKCFAEKIGNEIKSARDESISKLLHNLVQEKVHNIIDTKGSSQMMPKTIFNILCSQACRGAIKFGDELTLEACVELIDELKDCKMPFQCAHGRPVLTPLLDLNSIQPTESYV